MSEAGDPLWHCQSQSCGAMLRSTEVRRVVTPRGALELCPRCGSPVTTMVEEVAAVVDEERRKNASSLASALVYPLRGWGLVALGVGTILVGLLAFGLPFLYGYVINVLVYGYMCNYLFDVVLTTANDGDAPPGFPDFTSWWEDVLQPMLLVVSTTLLCYAPAVLYFVMYLVHCWYQGWVPEPDEPVCAVGVIVLAVISSFYYPMALLAVVTHNAQRAADPRLVIPAIQCVLGPYLVGCGFMILTGLVQVGFRWTFRGDSLVAHFLAVFLELWGAMVSMRLLGLLYRTHKEELGWF